MYLKECWEACLENKNTLIPAYKLKVEGHDKNIKILYVTTLKYFAEKSEMMSMKTNNNSEITLTNNNFQVNTDASKNYDITQDTENISNEIEQNDTPDFSIISTENNLRNTDDNLKVSLDVTPNSIIVSPLPKQKDLQLSSTPIQAKKKSQKTEMVSLKPKCINDEVAEAKPGLSKSATILSEIFGNQDFVLEFDKKRKILKANKCSAQYKEYSYIVAQIEVKLKIIKEELQKALTDLEVSLLNKTAQSKETTNTKHNLTKILKYIALIQRDLNLIQKFTFTVFSYTIQYI